MEAVVTLYKKVGNLTEDRLDHTSHIKEVGGWGKPLSLLCE
jgi:hypothetical protein